MTRRKKSAHKGQRKNDRNKKSQGNWDGHENRSIETENENFEKYYKAQGIIPESEWDAFMETLRRSLPSTFRIAGHREYVSMRYMFLKTNIRQNEGRNQKEHHRDLCTAATIRLF